MNKKSKESIRIDDLSEDDSRAVINVKDIRTAPNTAKAAKVPPPLALPAMKKGFKSSMKKKNCQTDVSLGKPEKQVSVEEPELEPAVVTKMKPVHPLPLNGGITKNKPKLNQIAPFQEDNSGMSTERPGKAEATTERPMLANENHINLQRRDARIRTRLLDITENFQRELGVGPNRLQNSENLFNRRKSITTQNPKSEENDPSNSNVPKQRVAVTQSHSEVQKSDLTKMQKLYLDFNTNKIVSQITGIIILISIFGDDLRRCSVPPAYDSYVDGFMTVLMAIFFVEMVANVWILKRKYLLSLDIAFDIMSTMSMLMDVTYFSEDVLSSWQQNQNSNSSEAAGQFGSRISKLIKLVRLIRLLRLSKALSKGEAAIGEKLVDPEEEEMKFAEKQIVEIIKKKTKEDERMKKQNMTELKSPSGRNASRKCTFNSVGQLKLPSKSESRVDSMQDLEKEINAESVKDEDFDNANKQQDKLQFPSTFKQDLESIQNINILDLVSQAIKRKRERKQEAVTRELLNSAKNSNEKIITSDSYFEKITFKKKSKAGKIWNERTVKKLIFLVLIMNLGMTVFDSSLYLTVKDVWDLDIEVLGGLISKNTLNSSNINSYMKNLISKYQTNDITFFSIDLPNLYTYKNPDLNLSNFRSSEISQAAYKDNNLNLKFLVDRRKTKFFDSLLQLLNMVFIVATLVGAYIFSSKDSNIFISGPVHKLASIWNVLLMNPMDIVFNPHYLQSCPQVDMFDKLEDEYKTIGNEFSKLSVWLSYCYGRRMVPLITNRFIMCRPSKLTDMVGDKYCAYFCLIEISSFLDDLKPDENNATEYIQSIFDIVFRTADQYNAGTSYLNEGRFFLIWKLNAINYEANFKNVSRDSSETASLTISTNLKIMYGLAYSYKLMETPFKCNDLARSTIHCGVLYESIVGSPLQKIDVQYFGLDLNALHVFHDMSNRYKTNLLLTEQVFTNIPECMKVKCRKIDVIKFPFYPKQIDIYTIDLKLDEVQITAEDENRLPMMSTYKKRLAHCMIKDYIDEKLIKGAKNILFLEDPDLDSLISRNHEFRKNFRNSVDFYLLGAWDQAKPFLQKARELEPEDGPSKFLWDFMSSQNWEKPITWRQFRICSKTVK